MTWAFGGLETGKYAAILADPPWRFRTWSETNQAKAPSKHYALMREQDIMEMPVDELAADDCVLFLWACWPTLKMAFSVISSWGFEYKTCAFDWMKADNTQPHFFQEEISTQVGLGYWTRANTEPCLLATRGRPKRLNADVRQGIIAPRREHSRKPDGIHDRIERLVAGPYVELFARQRRPGWDCWGNETDKFQQAAE